ncbi:MAG: Holliday junction DNA helicase RuvA [Nitrospirae bacterium GWA2_42_11]|nr:MAG: Holliday junction DNA helicase RuvA [Nitrospirae bacterium GWA2_42_11]
MRILALDVGDKRIGVAVSDELEIAAHGLKTIDRSDPARDIRQIIGIVKEYEVEEIIVGMPVMMDGSMGIQGEKVSQFVEGLRTEVKIPIRFMDERLSTKMVEKALIEADMSRSKRKKVIDKLAAVVILQDYLAGRPK